MILTLAQEEQLYDALMHSLRTHPDEAGSGRKDCITPVKIPTALRELIELPMSVHAFNPMALAALIRIWNLTASLLDKPALINRLEQIQKGIHPEYPHLAGRGQAGEGEGMAEGQHPTILTPLGVADLLHELLLPMDADQLDDYFEMAHDLGFKLAHHYFDAGMSNYSEGLFLQYLIALSAQINEQIIRNRLFDR